MKRMLMLGVLVFWHGSSAFAQDFSWRAESGMPQYGSVEVRGSEGDSDVRVGIDKSETVKAMNLSIGKDEKGRLVFGFLNKKEIVKNGTALKVRYERNFDVASGSAWDVSNETKVALGYLESRYEFGDSGRSMPGGPFNHMLFGVSNHLGGEWRTDGTKTAVRIGGATTGSRMSDGWGSLTEWDNSRVGIDALFEVPVSEGKLRLEAELYRTRYNPERYFFVEKWTDDYRTRMELAVPLDSWRLIPSLEYRKLDIERDRLTDLERPEFGLVIVRKNILKSKTDGFLKGIYAPWTHKRGHETLIAVGANSSDMGGEIYRREIVDQYSSFTLKDSIYGVRFSWKFGESENEIRKGIEKYGETADDKYAFYPGGDSVADDKSLTLGQQAERIGSVRRRVEWNAKSLVWKQAPNFGSGFRFTDEVYEGRVGDCDEQSCLNNRIDRLNGYESHTVAYWDLLSSGFSGHAVTVFKDPKNGQWFIDEYGMPFKIKGLGPNASKEAAMRAGLLQNSRFMALKIRNPGSSYFEVRDCNDASASNPPSYGFGDVPEETGRPSIERGVELFTKRGFLFE